MLLSQKQAFLTIFQKSSKYDESEIEEIAEPSSFQLFPSAMIFFICQNSTLLILHSLEISKCFFSF